MPLIRYNLGDRGALQPPGSECPCGRNLPRIAFIEGRNDDILYTRSGSRVGRLDPVLKGDLPVKEVQFVQKTLDSIVVNLVPALGYDQSAAATITSRLQQRMGDIEVLINAVDLIPRSANGKFRSVVCQLPQDQIRAVSKLSS
jgi:phenylacetate-CoA ligase